MPQRIYFCLSRSTKPTTAKAGLCRQSRFVESNWRAAPPAVALCENVTAAAAASEPPAAASASVTPAGVLSVDSASAVVLAVHSEPALPGPSCRCSSPHQCSHSEAQKAFLLQMAGRDQLQGAAAHLSLPSAVLATSKFRMQIPFTLFCHGSGCSCTVLLLLQLSSGLLQGSRLTTLLQAACLLQQPLLQQGRRHQSAMCDVTLTS